MDLDKRLYKIFSKYNVSIEDRVEIDTIYEMIFKIDYLGYKVEDRYDEKEQEDE